MRDHDHRAREGVQGAHERVARFHVQMVGRLVEDQEVRPIHGGEAQQQAGLLAAGQGVRARFVLGGGEAHPRDRGAHGALAGGGRAGGSGACGHGAAHVLDGVLVRAQVVHVVLREHRDFQARRARHRAVLRVEPARHELCEGRLAVAVGAYERDAVVGVDAQIEIPEDPHVAVARVDAGHVDDRRRHRPVGLGEVKRRGVLVVRDGDVLHAREHLQAALRLPGLGRLGAETVDEALQLGTPRVLLRLERRLVRVPLRALACEGRVVARIGGEVAIVEVDDAVAHAVQKVAVVRDDDRRVAVACDVVLQPQRAFEVEVVGRLVEQQKVRLGEQDGRERDAHAPAAGEGRAGPRLRRRVEAQTVKDGRRARLGRMGVDVGEARVDVGDASGVARGFRLREERRALRVGVEHGVEQRALGAGRFLRHLPDARAALQFDRAGFRLKVARQKAEQRRLSRAVAPDQPAARPRGHEQRRAFQQRPPGQPVGEVGNGEHQTVPGRSWRWK